MNIYAINFIFLIFNTIIFNVESSAYQLKEYHNIGNLTFNSNTNSTWLIKILKINSLTKCLSECDNNQLCLSITFCEFEQMCALLNKYFNKNRTIPSSITSLYEKKNSTASNDNRKIWYIVGILALFFVVILVYTIVRIVLILIRN